MVGLNRLQFQIESRKLMFLHIILSLLSAFVTRDIFTRKLIMFLNDKACNFGIHTWYLSTFIKISPTWYYQQQGKWSATVKRNIRASEYELSSDPDFTFYRILQPYINPAVVHVYRSRTTVRSETICAPLRAYDADQLFWRTSYANVAIWCLKKNLCTLLANA